MDRDALRLIEKLEENPALLVVRMYFFRNDPDAPRTMLVVKPSAKAGKGLLGALEFDPRQENYPRIDLVWPNPTDREEFSNWLGMHKYRSWRKELAVATEELAHDEVNIGVGSPRVLQQLMQVRGTLLAMPRQGLDPNELKVIERFVDAIQDFVTLKNREAYQFGLH